MEAVVKFVLPFTICIALLIAAFYPGAHDDWVFVPEDSIVEGEFVEEEEINFGWEAPRGMGIYQDSNKTFFVTDGKVHYVMDCWGGGVRVTPREQK